MLQAYGYDLLPLLLSLSSPPLSILVPNPLPPSTPAAVNAAKLPFNTIRKSLRLLIDDNPEALEEVENDISFVYSGYAPISIRVVQCVAQKNGVISNPAVDKATDRTTANNTGDNSVNQGDANGKGKSMASKKLYAHPIVGWKGFDDVLGTLPGKTFDIPRKVNSSTGPSPHASLPSEWIVKVGVCLLTRAVSPRSRAIHHHRCVLPWWVHIH